MLNFEKGRPLAIIKGGRYNGEIVCIQTEDDDENEDPYGKCNCCTRCSGGCKYKPCCKKCNMFKNNVGQSGKNFELKDGKLIPLPKLDERSVDYVCGPSGSGKSTYAGNLIVMFKKTYPEKDVYVFSRTDPKNDPVFQDIDVIYIPVDDTIVTDPIDITKELTDGCMVLFDDCNTIIDNKQKKEIDKLMSDIMEIGRKLNIWIIITNHLVNPNEKKMARTVMNEMHSITIFPKSGSAYQIRYCLRQYFGISDKQISRILNLPSRWVTIHKNYPTCVVYDKGAYIL